MVLASIPNPMVLAARFPATRFLPASLWLALAVGGPAMAQESAPELVREPSSTPMTANSPVPGLEGADFRLKEPRLRWEGTFLSRQVGSMVTLRTGDRAVVFQAPSSGRSERPMIVLPGQHLERLEELAATREATTLYSLTGQVFLYRGMNYLLLSVPPTLASSSEIDAMATASASSERPSTEDHAAGAPGEASSQGAGAERRPGAEAEPSGEPAAHASESGATAIGLQGTPEPVENIIAQLEQLRQGQRTLARPGASEEEADTPLPGQPAAPTKPTPNSPAGSNAAPAAMPEGKMISRRTGRFVRGDGGRWVLALESDADSPAPAPMTLVPCATLERLEAIAGVLGPGVQVQVSGRTLAYRGQNYLLPTMVRLATPSDLKPRQ